MSCKCKHCGRQIARQNSGSWLHLEYSDKCYHEHGMPEPDAQSGTDELASLQIELSEITAERDTLKAQCAVQAALLSAFQDGGAEANEAEREDLIEQLEAERDALKAENAAGCHAVSQHNKTP